MTGPHRASGAIALRAGLLGVPAIFLAFLLLAPADVRGDGLPVEFPEALARAMKNNPFLSAAGEEWTAAKMDAKIARGQYLP
ncbi:MAG: hypothetical protein FIA93_08675, partial [Deltaproteobacteria bacterium]|nr:hypothetical protein [Deltaproteobacteria bacterium]